MMINKRLIGTVSESRKYVAANVALQWCSLVANIAMMTSITGLLASLMAKAADTGSLVATAAAAAIAVIVRLMCTVGSSRMVFLSSRAVKKTLRERIYGKLLRLGASYNEQVKTSEVVQVAVEGVDQLETYFGAYLPQFFYAMLAPLTLFVYLCFVNIPSAVVLLICVPLIPVSIAAVQTWAKKLLSKYWGQYTALGDTFLENLQGLTTLKIYQADDFKNEEMNRESEKFRRITMKVLTMQLNSITIMDLIAYGGAALGVIMAATQFRAEKVSLAGCLLIILLAADFFIPMRQLGSYFHIAMNGMAASDKIFRLLDLPEPERKTKEVPADRSIVCVSLRFSYEESDFTSQEKREILHGIDLELKEGSFTSIVGESGCGKSTVAAVLMGRNRGYSGSVRIGGVELHDIDEASLMKSITYISHQSYLFKGTVRENLLMGKPDASDGELWEALRRTKLADFIESENGLDTLLAERASNLSGGQCQRLALARALLHDSPVYIFDEATSNIDVESENDIMQEIHALAGEKTVLLISHRLANVTNSDSIYVMDKGNIVENGRHEELLAKGGVYAGLWDAQQSLENYGK
ncbi:MAG: ABC transporter ATP-binding protein/permease [Acetatifactor sp.]|nr:ABC transporter ATP-binding protein/permease [Acetatifactor sp.]